MRSRRTLIILLATLAAATFLLFGSFELDHGNNRSFYGRLMDAGHFPLFAAVCVVSSLCGFSLLRTAFSLAAFALIVEFLQPYFDRSESLVDLQNGLLGIAFGAGLVVLRRRNGRPQAIGMAILLGAACALLLLVPAYREWQSIEWRRLNLPVLATFRDPLELRLWEHREADEEISFVPAPGKAGEVGMHVLAKGESGVSAVYLAGDLDWSPYGSFQLEVFSPQNDVKLRIRIDDSHDCREYDSRFNRVLPLDAGWNHIDLSLDEVRRQPKDRLLDLKEIRRIIFFTQEMVPGGLIFQGLKLVPDRHLG